MKQYKRTGTCQPDKCGAVCCKIGLSVKFNNDPAFEEYARLYGYEIKIVDGEKYALTNMVCKKLCNDKCSIQKTKPRMCTIFPESPDDSAFKIVKKLGCTYDFVEVKL